jgi:adenylosuccinate lyase
MLDALTQEPALREYFAREDFKRMLAPNNYLGSSDEFIENVLTQQRNGGHHAEN